MAEAYLVKVKLDGDLRIMEVPAPPRFSSLEKAVAEAYGLNEVAGMTFTYKDSDGDQVKFFGSLNNPLHAVLMSRNRREGTCYRMCPILGAVRP